MKVETETSVSRFIEYRCQRRDHQSDDASASRVFVYRGAWAYCEAGKPAEGHTFLAIGGVSRQWIERRRTAGQS
jgi:hypothetical protein